VNGDAEYIVFDLEWNIVGTENNVPLKEQKKLPFEIIEIGAVKLDQNMSAVGSFSTLVKPVLYPVLSRYVSRVTNRDQHSLSQGLLFPEAANKFLDFVGGKTKIFCSWSKSDPPVLIDNFNFYGIEFFQPLICLDVQALFSILAEKVSVTTQRSIEYALDFLEIPCNRPLHSALNDAYYTAMILSKIWQQIEGDLNKKSRILKSFQYQPSLKKRR